MDLIESNVICKENAHGSPKISVTCEENAHRPSKSIMIYKKVGQTFKKPSNLQGQCTGTVKK